MVLSMEIASPSRVLGTRCPPPPRGAAWGSRRTTVIDVAPQVNGLPERKMLAHMVEGAGADAVAQVFILQQHACAAGKCDHIPRRDQHAVDAVGDDLTQAWHIGRDHRPA